ncbi:ATP-binding protein [Vibrio navarrensis]|uniref:ATP-binding protein n=1 Tax=Vibrio navarrensis TaxID=29495 RepID=UPI00186A84F2|nr:sensor histidine kinase [Vibrio navarrensis]EJL6400677.1 sensor histidine kinase [Vibrio navarrensis]EJL6568117.1 sensor histidine kinase [Vibrio navarrensis]MBE4599720.1 histidine kinase [Vibrio navarrensis]MBE4607964.1 histidine kinase [Vibrio navarrensis]MBE4611728.1 histidine kinase [Vibrio navarrensis]
MKWQSVSFRQRMLLIMTLSGLIELLILVAAGFAYLKHAQEEEMGQKALGVARFLASSPIVIELIEQRDNVTHQARFRELTGALGAAFIVVGDEQGLRLIHPLDSRLGLPMSGGDNERALKEGEAYISTAKGSLGYSVRGKAAVFNAQGKVIGVVSVGYLLERLQDRIEPFIWFLIAMTVLVVAANALVSNYAARKFQKAILGFEPEEIGRLYSELDVTMSTIKEGILSIDANGVLRSINRSAAQILGLDPALALNRPLADSLPSSDLYRVLETGQEDHDIELYLNHKHLIANRTPVLVDGKVVGAVSSFRLRDEISELTEQLSQTKEYADLLRSQTHEHRNKLNTISGLVQMGELDAVQQLIGQETEHYQGLIEFLRDTIKDPLVAGMLLGKTERARELGLELSVEEGSRLEPLPDGVNAEDITTILGNLIDNAFDATMSGIAHQQPFAKSRRNIEVSVSDYGTEIILEVTDQGCGLPEGYLPQQLVEKGVSSKAKANRGVGLYLVSQLAQRYGGHIEMSPNKQYGTRMTVYIPKEEQQ